jgi:hypothetical protein
MSIDQAKEGSKPHLIDQMTDETVDKTTIPSSRKTTEGVGRHTKNDSPGQSPREEALLRKPISKRLNETLNRRLGPTLSRRISEQISTAINSRLARSAQAAASHAKDGLDQLLLGLNHKGLTRFRDTDDVIQQVGRGVLERAEAVRSQLEDRSLSPSWLKGVSFRQPSSAGQEEDLKTETQTESAIESENTNDEQQMMNEPKASSRRPKKS